MKKLVFITLISSLALFSCERKSDNKSTNVSEASSESVKKDVDILLDSLHTAWKNLIASDDQKFQDIKRLLDEISYTSSYDIVAHDSLVKKIELVKVKRFDQNLDTNAIDNYYLETDKLIFEVLQLKRKTKGIEQHPLADELESDILTANSQETIVQHMKNYNWWANQYNSYLKKHKNKLKKLGEPYASYKETAILYEVK